MDMQVTKQLVLVIDDDEEFRSLLRIYLEDRYEVIETGDSGQALKLTFENRPSAILLDLLMPVFTGFEICKALSSLSFTKDIPIFIITGGDPRNRAFCESLGARAYLQKPIKRSQLRELLARTIPNEPPLDGVERRRAARKNVRMPIRLRWKDQDGFPLECRTVTENVSDTGFLCGCKVPIDVGTSIDVFVGHEGEHYMGTALVVRTQGDLGNRLYGCHFTRKGK